MENMIITERKYQAIAARVKNSKDGPLAEIGVAHGGVIDRLSAEFPERKIYAYDTFTGMPKEKWEKGEHHRPGDFYMKGVDERLSKLPNVVVRKGIFPDTLGDETGFVVVHLDVDFYKSTLESLRAIIPRMVHGGRIVLDDWGWCHCPGVARAVNELGLKAIPTCHYQAEIEIDDFNRSRVPIPEERKKKPILEERKKEPILEGAKCGRQHWFLKKTV